MLTKKKYRMGLLISAGLIIFISGAYFKFLWLKGDAGIGDYDVEGGSTRVLSWYLQEGDRTEGGFTVSGGNEEVRFFIKNPSGDIIYNAGIVKAQLWHGFSAEDSGTYSFHFENPEYSNAKIIHAKFNSPYEPRLTYFEIWGYSMMFGGTVILVYGVRGFLRAYLPVALSYFGMMNKTRMVLSGEVLLGWVCACTCPLLVLLLGAFSLLGCTCGWFYLWCVPVVGFTCGVYLWFIGLLWCFLHCFSIGWLGFSQAIRRTVPLWCLLGAFYWCVCTPTVAFSTPV